MSANHRQRGTRAIGVALIAAALTIGIVWGTPRRSAAATVASFTATASAAGVRITVTAQNAPLTSTPVDVGGPVAQAELDSLGTSAAFASFPYPGDVVVNLPGTLAGLTQGGVHLPPYPFYVGSTYPLTPTASTAQGPYTLQATSEPGGSTAAADAGLSGSDPVTSLSTRASVVRQGGGAVVAHSQSATSPLALGALHLGTITSDATATLGADGSLARASHLDISSISVGGLSIAVTDKGFTVLNSTVPVPSLDTLNALLAPQHIQVAYVAARPTPDGVISAALQISDVQTFPDVGASSVTYILGQDSATIQGATVPAPSPAAPVTTAPPAVAAAPATPAGPPPGPVGVAPPVPAMPAAVPASPPAPAVALPERPALFATVGGFSVFRFYVMLVAAALAALGLGLVFGRMGVRSPWTT